MSAHIHRRQLLTAVPLLGAAGLLAACGSDDGSDAAPSVSVDPSAAESKATPLEHPAGMTYGEWFRESSHLLDVGDSDAVLVEFLDFECESCGGIYPTIEDLRTEFEGRLNFAIRYFPLDGHQNARPAAYAVEAAARQEKLEAMYSLMFQNQASWGEQAEGAVDGTFIEFARAIDLDFDQWDSDRKSKEVADRVQLDFDDATALGLRGTPSFFLNGETLQPESIDDLRNAIAGAVG